MKKQAFRNSSLKDETTKIEPIKNEKEKFIAKLENTKSVLDFYNQKTKIINLLRETRK